MSARQRLQDLPTRATDAAIVLLIGVFAAFFSGSRTWVGFNSPDSEFYASLALFGNEVSDRAIEPAYTWTRLGYIAPVRALVTTVDPWIGFILWRFILILIIVGSIYAIARITSTRQMAVLMSVAAAMSTVVMGSVGNTYLTGTILAATTLLLALGVWGSLGAPRPRWLPALLAGAAAGWLIMLNPYALLLGMTMWLGLRVMGLLTTRNGRWTALGQDALAGIGGFCLSFVLFLLAGMRIFPGRNWLQTYLDWNSRLDYASFIGDRDVWQRDVALLVPVAALVVAVLAAVVVRASRTAAAAIVVSALNISFTAIYFLLVPGPWLESPTYVAKLWSGALVAIALAFAALVGKRDLGALGWLLGLLALPLLLWSGRWDRTISVSQGLAVLAVVVLVFGIAAVASRRGLGAWFSVTIVVALAVMATGAQILQNGRGLLGTYGQYPFSAAYLDTDAERLMRSKVAAEEFVLSRTTHADTIGIWTDSARLGAASAAMQMWGKYNNVSGGDTLTREEVSALEVTRPTAIAMYAPDRHQIDEFWASLPPWSRPTGPECTAIPYVGIGSPDVHVCVTHLSWVR